jgi:hypothetical protein
LAVPPIKRWRSPMRGVMTVAMEMVVSPARRAADRRTPIWLAKNAADHAAGDGADRPRDQEAGSRPGASANPIGPRSGRRQRNNRKHH